MDSRRVTGQEAQSSLASTQLVMNPTNNGYLEGIPGVSYSLHPGDENLFRFPDKSRTSWNP